MSRCIACLTAWLVVGCGGGGAAAPPASDASGAPTASPAAGAESAAAHEDTFVNKTVGLRLKKPKGWFFETAQFETENRERTKWANEKMDEGVKRATLPLVVVVKHRPPYDGIGPVMRVTVRPAGGLAGMPLKQLVESLNEASKQLNPDAPPVFDGEMTETTVGGLPAAHIRTELTFQMEDGRQFDVLSRILIVPRGATLFLIGMSAPPEGPEACEPEFEEVVRSIEIRPVPR